MYMLNASNERYAYYVSVCMHVCERVSESVCVMIYAFIHYRTILFFVFGRIFVFYCRSVGWSSLCTFSIIFCLRWVFGDYVRPSRIVICIVNKFSERERVRRRASYSCAPMTLCEKNTTMCNCKYRTTTKWNMKKKTHKCLLNIEYVTFSKKIRWSFYFLYTFIP